MDNQIEQFEQLTGLVDGVGTKYSQILSEYFPKEWDTVRNDILSFKKNYFEKLNEARKLRIGIVGQIKAGKSTFLNCLLFEGKDILPKAVTPMTAALTHIAYDDQPHAEVEFFDEADIKEIEKVAQGFTDKTYERILQDVRKPEIKELMKQKTKSLDFSSILNLKESLKDYISENGKYINIVKFVSIYLNYEPIRYIEIIDTPGINDPIVSRSIKTQMFVESCDILFLLSRASQFLEISDISLLTQIYRKKSAKIYVISSKIDSVIDDAVTIKKNFGANFKDLFEKELDKRKREFSEHLNTYKKDGKISDDMLDEVIDKNLFYFSSAFYKKLNNIPLNSDEEIPINKISERTKGFALDSYITGFEPINKVLDLYKEEKDANAAKSKIVQDYTSIRTKSIKDQIDEFSGLISDRINKKADELKKDAANLKNQKNTFNQQKEEIKNKLSEVYGKYLTKAENQIDEVYKKINSKILSNLNSQKLMEGSQNTGYKEYTKKMEQSGFLATLARFFGLGGYEEVPFKDSYKYFDRDIIIDTIRRLISNINEDIDIKIKRTFEVNSLKQELMNIFKQYRSSDKTLDKILNRAINLSVNIPHIEISQNLVSSIYAEINSKSKEIKVEDLESISQKSKDIIRHIGGDLEKLKISIKQQVDEQISNIIKTIEANFNNQIDSITKMENLKQEDLSKLYSQFGNLRVDLDKINKAEILNK